MTLCGLSQQLRFVQVYGALGRTCSVCELHPKNPCIYEFPLLTPEKIALFCLPYFKLHSLALFGTPLYRSLTKREGRIALPTDEELDHRVGVSQMPSSFGLSSSVIRVGYHFLALEERLVGLRVVMILAKRLSTRQGQASKKH